MKQMYKMLMISIMAFMFSNLAIGQNPIPNPGFENWTSGNPDGWYSSNIPGFYIPITQSGSSHSGNYAVRGEVVTYDQTPVLPALFPVTVLIPITQNYTRMTGYYQMTNQGEDAFYAEVIFYDAQSLPVAVGISELGPTNGGYQMFTVDMIYESLSQQPAANAYVLFGIDLASESSLEAVTVGSSFLLDDLAFDMVSTVDGPAKDKPLVFSLDQNYPNPFNPETMISFTLPEAGKKVLSIYNNLGQEVRSLINEDMAAGPHQVSFNAVSLPSGIYYYQLESGSYRSVKKMMLVR